MQNMTAISECTKFQLLRPYYRKSGEGGLHRSFATERGETAVRWLTIFLLPWSPECNYDYSHNNNLISVKTFEHRHDPWFSN